MLRGARWVALAAVAYLARPALPAFAGDEAPPATAAAAAVPSAPVEHVASDADFAGFRRWTRFDIPDIGMGQGHRRGGPSHLYVNRALPRFDDPVPPGTILVKTVEPGDDPREWQVHAMVKRGGAFNARGARGWEWFDLRLDADGRPSIAWRGQGDVGHAEHGYGPLADGRIPGCNDCHGVVPHNDFVFTRSLLSPLD